MAAVRVERESGLTWIVLDRPRKANSLTAEMLESVRDNVRAATTPALAITGTGRVFSGGADLPAARAGLAASPLWEEVSSAVANFPGLTVAALNGSCAGGALGMVLACDCRVAVPGATFFYPVMKHGFLPPPSDPVRLSALINAGRAKMMLMCGAKVSTEEACAWGLVDRVVEDARAAATALAADVLAGPEGHGATLKALFPR
ncbi:Enoyl-CoA hydratase/carnithine racemase [Palleronia marisminoris]|uniref:Putative enoyl-CoA hydratase echA6 n=2 Tax=Palleronia marisminoris TaxID=315423 RepID=A0A1Y5SI19_9RHOB|nr:enoyl-CoA hydratase/isomerase family protein [Palleronia marisminoris]SFG83415.1 Enoyl-CoA hydratase/carnithine racemase [Palleronia marisminoris]SLN40989.1 putative enoyl-CoA hydratase echA6 [Palleronia marisminoris]